MTYQIDILDPKAGQLLEDLANLKLITIRQTTSDGFMQVIQRLRTKAAKKPISLAEITREVETVRAKRYASKKIAL